MRCHHPSDHPLLVLSGGGHGGACTRGCGSGGAHRGEVRLMHRWKSHFASTSRGSTYVSTSGSSCRTGHDARDLSIISLNSLLLLLSILLVLDLQLPVLLHLLSLLPVK
ncbi:uncharacterized protein DS421_3g82940 [Arachis hypogaea]|nr:uncharacterized protein DS421_3g82940 [Arachis hypogaea]